MVCAFQSHNMLANMSIISYLKICLDIVQQVQYNTTH